MKLRRQQNLQRRPCSLLCGWEALGEEDLQEGNQNHWNSISRSRGDDPTFRGSLRRSVSRLAARSRLPPCLLNMRAHKHSDRQACLNISSTRVWRGLITSWDLGLWCLKQTLISLFITICICLCELPFFPRSSVIFFIYFFKLLSLDSHLCV